MGWVDQVFCFCLFLFYFLFIYYFLIFCGGVVAGWVGRVCLKIILQNNFLFFKIENCFLT